jgi:hypothetical protein
MTLKALSAGGLRTLESISLEGLTLPHAAFLRLIKGLAGCETITSIDLARVTLVDCTSPTSDLGMKRLARSSVRSLNVSGFHPGDVLFRGMLHFDMPWLLTSLSLARLRLNSDQVDRLCRALRHKRQLRYLDTLDVSGNGFTDGDTSQLAAAIIIQGNVRTLVYTDNNVRHAGLWWLAMVRILEHIDLRSNGLTVHDIASGISRISLPFPVARTINLAGNALGPQGMVAVHDLFRTSARPRLHINFKD